MVSARRACRDASDNAQPRDRQPTNATYNNAIFCTSDGGDDVKRDVAGDAGNDVIDDDINDGDVDDAVGVGADYVCVCACPCPALIATASKQGAQCSTELAT